MIKLGELDDSQMFLARGTLNVKWNALKSREYFKWYVRRKLLQIDNLRKRFHRTIKRVDLKFFNISTDVNSSVNFLIFFFKKFSFLWNLIEYIIKLIYQSSNVWYEQMYHCIIFDLEWFLIRDYYSTGTRYHDGATWNHLKGLVVGFVVLERDL